MLISTQSVLLLLLILAVSAQQGWNSEEIPKKTAEDIINNPVNAREHWSSLSDEQRESVFKNPVGLIKFSKEFSEKYEIKSLALAKGLPRYDGISLINGDASIPVSSIKGAEVISLPEGGFKIRFQKEADVTKIEFAGGSSGIIVEGENIKTSKGDLSKGAVAIYKDKIQVQPFSEFSIEKIKLATGLNSLNIYQGEAQALQANSMYIHKLKKTVQIAGNDIAPEFEEGHEFEKVYTKGRIKVKELTTLAFDGQGRGVTEIPLQAPRSKLTIIDLDNADNIHYFLQPEQITATSGSCSVPQLTGSLLVDITGSESATLCNHVRMIPTGTAEYKGGGFILPKYEFTTTFFLEEKEAQNIRQQFTSQYNKEPNLNSLSDLRLLAELINQRATYLKLEQQFEIFPQPSESTARNIVDSSLRKAGVKDITDKEQDQLNQLYALIYSAKIAKGDRIEYLVNGNTGSIRHIPKTGNQEEFPVSPRLVRAMIQNYYNPNVNKDPESRYFLEAYFGPKKTSLK